MQAVRGNAGVGLAAASGRPSRLVRLRVYQGGHSTGAESQFFYDGLHRRVWTWDAQTDTEHYYYHNLNWQLLEDRKKEDEHTRTHKQYVWDIRYIDSPVLRWCDYDGDGNFTDPNEVLYYTNDGNFNVTALVNPGGDVVERYAYDPYGQVTVLNGAADADPNVAEWTADPNGSDWDNTILYCGYHIDWRTGLYHVRFRYLHPLLGRWMGRDLGVLAGRPSGIGAAAPAQAGQSISGHPKGQYGDGMSLYQYGKSSPGNLRDPGGLAAIRYRKLRWEDFGGEVINTASGKSYIRIIPRFGDIEHLCEEIREKEACKEPGADCCPCWLCVAGYAFIGTRAWAEFDQEKSWIDPDGREGLLKHEQGHFDLAAQYAARLVRQLQDAVGLGTGCTKPQAQGVAEKDLKSAGERVVSQNQEAWRRADEEYELKEGMR